MGTWILIFTPLALLTIDNQNKVLDKGKRNVLFITLPLTSADTVQNLAKPTMISSICVTTYRSTSSKVSQSFIKKIALSPCAFYKLKRASFPLPDITTTSATRSIFLRTARGIYFPTSSSFQVHAWIQILRRIIAAIIMSEIPHRKETVCYCFSLCLQAPHEASDRPLYMFPVLVH